MVRETVTMPDGACHHRAEARQPLVIKCETMHCIYDTHEHVLRTLLPTHSVPTVFYIEIAHQTHTDCTIQYLRHYITAFLLLRIPNYCSTFQTQRPRYGPLTNNLHHTRLDMVHRPPHNVTSVLCITLITSQHRLCGFLNSAGP